MPKQGKNVKAAKVDSRVRRAEAGKLIYKIDCGIPCSDELINDDTMNNFATYLTENLKIQGKTGQLGDKVKVSQEDNKIVVTKFKVLFAKRYLKFLTRKFLKKEKLRDYVRPVATSKHDYQLRYYNIHLDDEEEA